MLRVCLSMLPLLMLLSACASEQPLAAADIQKPLNDTASAGIQKTSIDAPGAGLQQPLNDTASAGVQKPLSDTASAGSQKTSIDAPGAGLQKPSNDTASAGNQKSPSDTPAEDDFFGCIRQPTLAAVWSCAKK
jgi:hypothetical protein